MNHSIFLINDLNGLWFLLPPCVIKSINSVYFTVCPLCFGKFLTKASICSSVNGHLSPPVTCLRKKPTWIGSSRPSLFLSDFSKACSSSYSFPFL